jgi:hypothetical protein
LPVHLLSFTTAVNDNRYISIDWKTTEESGIDFYEVERSTDGGTFTGLGKVQSKNSTIPAGYHFEDASPVAGRNYYRLKIVNQDGKIEYSKISTIVFKGRLVDNLQLYRMGNTLIAKNNTNEISNITLSVYNGQGQQMSTMYKVLMPGSNTIARPAIMTNGSLYFIRTNVNGKESKTFSIMW